MAPIELVGLIQEVHRAHFSEKDHFVLASSMVEDVLSEERQDAIVMREHEILKILITDHETTFKSIDFQEFVQSFGTQIGFASSSESNGQIECAHSTIIEIFNTNKHKYPNCATKMIIRACTPLYNWTIHSTTSFAPNEIIFNQTDQQPSSETIEKIYSDLKSIRKRS